MKHRKNVSIDEDIAEDIEKRSQQYGFNLSDWFSQKYREQFLSIEQKKQEINHHEQRIKQLRDEIENYEKAEKTYMDALSRSEIRFIKRIPTLLKERKEFSAICERYNTTFGKRFSINELKRIVKVINSESRK